MVFYGIMANEPSAVRFMCGVIVALEGCLGMLDGSTGAGGWGEWSLSVSLVSLYV